MLLPSDLGLPTRFPSFRPHQGEAALNLAAGDRRFSVVNAEVGTGKSLLAVATSRLLSARTLYLVSTKVLASQLLSDFAEIGMVEVRGHTSYPCAVQTTSKYEPLCSWPRERCQYRIDVEAARGARLVVSNYAFWLTLARYSDPSVLGQFDLLVCDEAHAAEEWLSKWCAVTLSRAEVKALIGWDLPLTDIAAGDTDGWAKWAYQAGALVREKYQLAKDVKKDERENENLLQRLNGLGKDLAELARAPESGVKWVTERLSGGASVKFSPVWSRPWAERYLFRGIPRVILCSATIFPEDAGYLGISESDHEYVEVASGFDPRRAPFIYIPTVRVGKNMDEGMIRVWVNKIDEILKGRLDRKGLVQTTSYAYAHEIMTRSRHRGNGYLLHHTTKTAREVIQAYRESEEPCALVSPSVWTGHDFPEDLCRFNIITKIPFPDTRDPVLSARMDDDKRYRNHLAAVTLRQGAGRGNRSARDFSETLLVDDHWKWFKRAAKFSKAFQRTWRWEDSVPDAPRLEGTR